MLRPTLASRSPLRVWLRTGAFVLVVGVGLLLTLSASLQLRASDAHVRDARTKATCARASARVEQLLAAAEMVAASAVGTAGPEALAQVGEWQAIFERLVPAFEQRPELTWLGFSSARTGEAAFLHRRPEGHLEWVLFRDNDTGKRRHQVFRYRTGHFTLIREEDWDGYDPRRRPFFEHAMRTGRPGWAESYGFVDFEGGTPVLGVSHVTPVYSSSQELVGVWDVDFDSHALDSFMQQLQHETGVTPFVFERRADSSVVLLGTVDPHIVRESLGATSLEEWATRKALSTFPGQTWSMERHDLGAPWPAWSVISLLGESADERSIRQAQVTLLGSTTAFALLLAWAGSVAFARRVAQPVEALRAASERLKGGAYEVLPPTEGPSELVDLGAAFSAMAKAVELRELALRASNQSLGEEVRTRAEREALLGAVLANQPFALWVFSADGVCTLQNSKAREAYGDITSRRLEDVMPDRARALQFPALFERALSGEVVQQDVSQIVQGEANYSHALMAPVRQGDVVTGVLYVDIDVTERRRAEEALRASQRRVSLHLENTPLGVIDWTRDFKVTAWNSSAELIFGWSASEALGRYGHFMVPETERLAADSAWRSLLLGRRSVRYASRSLTRDGRLIECEWYLTVIPDAEGDVESVCALVLDVTERITAERLFRESEERFEVAFRQGPVAQCVLRRADTSLLDVNDRWVTLTRRTRNDVLGRTLRGTAFGVGDALLDGLLAELDSRGEVRNRELTLFDEAGRAGIFLVSLCAVSFGAESAVLCSLVNVTRLRNVTQELSKLNDGLEKRVTERTAELAQANEKLSELDRLKSEFLAMMSHELRTPLNSILGFSAILLEGIAGPLNPEQSKQLGLLQRSARHLLGLINDVLDSSRLQSGRIEFEYGTVQLDDITREVEETLRPLVERKGLRYETRTLRALPAMVTDRKRLFQVLLNLANNAVKFTDRGEVLVLVDLEPANGELVLVVRDEGIGMSQRQLERLFQPFVRFGSNDPSREGTGLGLYLVKQLVLLLGGRVEVTSALGQGTVATVRLPLVAPGAAKAATSSGVIQSGRNGGDAS